MTMAEQQKKTYGIKIPKISMGFMLNVEKGLERLKSQQKKSVKTAYLLAIFLGIFGAHHFYLNRWFMGFVYLLTFGVFGIGWIIDLFRIRSLVEDENDNDDTFRKNKRVLDAYLAWFPLGFIGFHHFHLRNYSMGFLYLVTLGVYGVGWALDGFYLPSYVEHANSGGKFSTDLEILKTYLIAASPFGILGGHQFYSGRKRWGLAYIFTLGGCGFWWLFDLFRISAIVHRRKQWKRGVNLNKRYTDDVYLIWFLFGLLGGHHFYLKRYRVGILYLCTLGCFGIGWMIDLVRLPWIVRDFNFDNCPEEDLPFTNEAIMENLSDFERKELQRAIRQARYSGENPGFNESFEFGETYGEEMDGDEDERYFNLDRIRNAIRASEHQQEEEARKISLSENQQRELGKDEKRRPSKVTTVAMVSNHSDIFHRVSGFGQDNSEPSDKQLFKRHSVILDPNNLIISQPKNKMARSKSIPARMSDTDKIISINSSVIHQQKSGDEEDLVQDDIGEKQIVQENDHEPKVMENGKCNQTESMKVNDTIIEYDSQNKVKSKPLARIKSEASVETLEIQRRKKLVRSNTQIGGLSWTDNGERKHLEQVNKGGKQSTEDSEENNSLPRVTQIPIKAAKRRASTSTLEMKRVSMSTNGKEERKILTAKGKHMQSEPTKRAGVRSLSENDSENVSEVSLNINPSEKRRSKSVSDEIVHIVSSASLVNVFEDIEELSTDNELDDEPVFNRPVNDNLPKRAINDTGIGIHNAHSIENKPITKRSMSFPSRQISLETDNDHSYQNGNVVVLNDNGSPTFMEKSRLALRRSSTQTGFVNSNKPSNKPEKRRRSLIAKLSKSDKNTPVTFFQESTS